MTSTGLGGLASEEAARAALSAGEVSLVMRDFLVGGADPRAAASVLLAMVDELFFGGLIGGLSSFLSVRFTFGAFISHLDIRFALSYITRLN